MDALRYAPADTVRMELNTGISPAIIVPVEGRRELPLHGAARAPEGKLRQKTESISYKIVQRFLIGIAL